MADFSLIYANGQKMARADTYDSRIYTTGTTPGGKLASWTIGSGGGYVIKNGDKLCLRQYQVNGRGGPNVQFTDGSQTYETLDDSAGQPISSLSTEGTWVDRIIDLSSDQGKTVSDYQAVADVTSPAGTYGIYYGDIVIVSLDGTVTSIYDGQQGGTFPLATNSGQTNVSAVEQRSESAGDAEQPRNVTAYYHGDHLGSTRVVTAAGGWPIASDDFLPFGQELTPSANPNHYKFTGKERDTESGNDYFGARYYASSMGRFMSPDWSAKPEDVPYADLDNPQSLNLYTYAGNNPLGRTDPDGHCTVEGKEHGGLRCFAHALGLVQTQHEQANDLRAFYQGSVFYGGDGKAVQPSKMSDGDIIQFNKDHRDSMGAIHWAMAAGAVAGADKLAHIYDRHAGDFGLSGNKNPEQLQKLAGEIDSHMSDPDTKLVQGQYRGQDANLYYNSRTQNVVVTDKSNNLIIGFKASPAQAGYINSTGRLN